MSKSTNRSPSPPSVCLFIIKDLHVSAGVMKTLVYYESIMKTKAEGSARLHMPSGGITGLFVFFVYHESIKSESFV